MADSVLLVEGISLKIVDQGDGTFALAAALPDNEVEIVGPADTITGAVETIPIEHEKIHDGTHFFVSGYVTLDSAAELDFVVTVPAGGPVPHIVFDVVSSGILTIEVREGVTIAQDGTPLTPINSNRNSTNVSGVAVVKDPTVTALGNQIDAFKWGDRSPGQWSREDELDLKMGASTLFRFTSGANGNVLSYRGLWYEV